jgi:transposase
MTTLTMRDEKRLDVIQRVYRSELTVKQAALVMGVSERQCYRVKARISKTGAKGVIHGNRGRRCKCRLKDNIVRRVLELARGKYQGFNDHHLTEKLKEPESIEMSREKVRGIVRGAGIASPKKRRGVKHRNRRERGAAEGMMLQVDGSPHDWLQGRGRTTRLLSKGRFCRSRGLRPFALMPTRESMSMCFSRMRWRFSTKPRKSQPSIQKQRTQFAYIER